MSFADASATRVIVNSVHASAVIDSWTVSGERMLSSVPSVLDTGDRFLPSIRNGQLSLTGMYEATTVTGPDPVFGTAITTASDDNLLWTFCPNGTTLGQRAYLTASDATGYKLASKKGDAVRMDISATPDDGPDYGFNLHALGAETANLNSTSVDNGAASTNGGVAMLHVTAYSGFTNVVLKTQMSTDNFGANTVDLVTFTTVTGVTQQRVLVAAGTSVSRYLRSSITVTGSGSITFHMAFARR
jgi:hypothetical protein